MLINREELLTVKNLILIILVCAVLIFFVAEFLLKAKIGRSACKIVSYTIVGGANKIGLISDAMLTVFYTTCDKLNW